MNTEITDVKNANGWILFDADCRLCAGFARRCGPFLRQHRFALVPLQTPWARDRLAIGDDSLLTEMRLLTLSGETFGGADALIEVAKKIWWARPLYWLGQVPGVRPGLRKGYAWVARRRYCLNGTCPVEGAPGRFGRSCLKWVPAIVMPVLGIAFGWSLPGWVCMWVLAGSLFVGAKWATISGFPHSSQTHTPRRLLAYSLLWPGMDARAFCAGRSVPIPPLREWVMAVAKTLFGAAVLWRGVHLISPSYPLVKGWVGMIGMVFVLHFGAFHLFSLLWRAFGIEARPIMQSPGCATSLSKFWGEDWNAAFSGLMREHFFKPMARYVGARRALFMVFLISGGLHELVISLPARGGYGLPTLYFALQGVGLILERAKFGRWWRLGSGWRGWCFVALVAGAPAFLLFHPTFIHNVILPMLRAIGST